MRSKTVLILIIFCLLGAYAERYALLVGNSYGGPQLGKLKYVKNDVTEMAKVLVQNGQFSKANVTTLYNQKPHIILQQLIKMQGRVSEKSKDILYFYYSGHADNKDLLMGNSRLSLATLKAELLKVNSSLNIVILDACQSGSFTQLKGGTVEAPFLFRQEDNIEGQVVLYSSSANEFSQESDLFKHSIFSFHFINGLRGLADESGDKKVTLNEVYRYAYNQTIASTVNSAGGIQHPGYLFDISGKGNIILADMADHSSGVVLDRAISGSVAILDMNKQIIADFSKEGDRDVFIALNPGRFTIYTNSSDAAARAKVQVRGDAIQHLTKGSFTKISSVPVYVKGGAPKKVTVKASVQFGIAIENHATLNSSLEDYYDGLQLYDISYRADFQRVVPKYGLGLSFIWHNGIILETQWNYFHFVESSTETGIIYSPADSTPYAVTVNHNDRLVHMEGLLLTGYQFQQGPVKNLALLAGVNLIASQYENDGTIEEELYNSSQSFNLSDQQLEFQPIVGLGYNIRLAPVFEIGLRSMYSFQIGSSGITTKDAALSYDPSGWRFDVGFLFTLNGN